MNILLSPQALELLGELATLGIYGRTRAEVASRFVDEALCRLVAPARLSITPRADPGLMFPRAPAGSTMFALVLDALRSGARTADEVATALDARDRIGTIWTTLSKLCAQGHARRVGRGLYEAVR